nr:hypothetical protein [Tanacetum cinerariifolium]
MSNAATISPGMYKLDPLILAPKVKNNWEAHEYYLKHTMEQAASLREIVEQAKLRNPLDSASYLACAKALCSVCNECFFDANHAMCLIDCVNSMNVHAKSTSKKNKKRKEWKPTGKVFNSVGYKWKPTRRTFTLVGNVCPLTMLTAIKKMEPGTSRGSDTLVAPSSSSLMDCRNIRTDNKTEFVNQTLRVYYEQVGISHETSVARTPQQNGVVERENLGKLQAKADIGIFIGYAPKNKAYRINRRTRKIIKTIHVDFDKLMAMTSEQLGSRPRLQCMTPATPSLGLVPNPPSSAPFVPPSRHEWDLVFQLVFDEFFSPPVSIASPVPIEEAPAPVESTGLPYSTTVDQDAPSPSTSQTTQQSQSQTINLSAEEESHDLEIAHMSNDPYFGISIPETLSKESSSLNVISTTMHSDAPISEHLRLQISQIPRGIILNQSKYALELLKKYEIESCDPVDTRMVEKSKLDEDTQVKAVDPTHYRGMVGTLMYLTSSRPDLHNDIRYHFIKEQRENGVVELYFVRREYQLSDIFTKALCRETIELLIDMLGMRSFTSETLKELADEAEE